MTHPRRLELFRTSWGLYSRRYGPHSDWQRIKVEKFYEGTMFGNSSFCRYSEWEQKTYSWLFCILLISGCGGRQSGKIVQKKVVKNIFVHGIWGAQNDRKTTANIKVIHYNSWKWVYRVVGGLKRVWGKLIFRLFWTLKAARPYIHHRRWWIRSFNWSSIC